MNSRQRSSSRCIRPRALSHFSVWLILLWYGTLKNEIICVWHISTRKKFPVTDTSVYISPIMLLFLRETGIHHLWLSNLTTTFELSTVTTKVENSYNMLWYDKRQMIWEANLVLLERVGSLAVPLIDRQTHVQNEHVSRRQARLWRRNLITSQTAQSRFVTHLPLYSPAYLSLLSTLFHDLTSNIFITVFQKSSRFFASSCWPILIIFGILYIL